MTSTGKFMITRSFRLRTAGWLHDFAGKHDVCPPLSTDPHLHSVVLPAGRAVLPAGHRSPLSS
jgi:hypothetical protein